MSLRDYKHLSLEELKNRRKVLKVILVLAVPIILGSIFFTLQDYFTGKKFDVSAAVLLICYLLFVSSSYYSFKKIGEDLRKRDLKR